MLIFPFMVLAIAWALSYGVYLFLYRGEKKYPTAISGADADDDPEVRGRWDSWTTRPKRERRYAGP